MRGVALRFSSLCWRLDLMHSGSERESLEFSACLCLNFNFDSRLRPTPSWWPLRHLLNGTVESGGTCATLSGLLHPPRVLVRWSEQSPLSTDPAACRAEQ